MRRGFTLVELLVAVSVIAILAGLLLGALYTAQDAARAQKTKSTIAKLHTKMAARWEAYKTRRVPIVVPPNASPPVAAAMRLTALRQLMIWELPDRNNEIPPIATTSASFPFSWTDSEGNPQSATIVIPRPSLSLSYLRRLGTPTDTRYSAAECLYLILTTSLDDDESGRESFGDSEVGDFDNDGRPEFKDAWNNPISWVRWPAGLTSELQPVDTATGNHDVVKNHDPFDSRRIDAAAYALYPLIFSPGPDGNYEINSEPDYVYVVNGVGILNPYAATNPTPLIGAWTDQNGDGANDSVDNIHNHLIGTR